MTHPIVIPSPPSAGNSPPSSDDISSPGPQQSENNNNGSTGNAANNNSNNNGNSNQMKRKPSRRANTAERRATHNAVERQRRETLNGRFLDLASLLPNLSQIRRPSKSSIVNSSIAHIHASRRHRLLASRELRLVKMEADALRRELNEWRDRAGIPRVEEPVRGEGFGMVLSGELEVLVVGGVGMEDDEDDMMPGYNGGSYDDEEYGAEEEDPRIAMIKNVNAAPFTAPPSTVYPQRPSVSISHHNGHHQAHHPHHAAAAVMGGPIIASPTAMSFDNPAMGSLYPEPHIQYSPHQQYPQVPQQFNGMIVDPEKVAQWNLGMYQQQQAVMMQQRTAGLTTPPSSTAGNPDQAYLASLGGRARSGSLGSGASASPPHVPGSLALGSSSGSSSGSASPVSHPFDGYETGYGDGTAWMGSVNGMPGKMVNVGGGNGGGAAFAMIM